MSEIEKKIIKQNEQILEETKAMRKELKYISEIYIAQWCGYKFMLDKPKTRSYGSFKY